jgi:hypothetical protein
VLDPHGGTPTCAGCYEPPPGPGDVPRGPYTIRWASDLGNDTPGALIGEHLARGEVIAWLDAHEDAGTFEIIDESNGLPACGHDIETAGGAWACDCGRATCPSTASNR